MRYQLELEIALPRERVLELFLDEDRLFEWQEGIVSHELINGASREVGAQSRQVHKMGNREVEMVETITTSNYPEEFAATYKAKNVWNLIENRFLEVSPTKTQWLLTSEFRCGGMMRLFAMLMPGQFKKQTLHFMNLFKSYAESVS